MNNILIPLAILTMCSSMLTAQNFRTMQVDIQNGWSGTSINATIFRKNSLVSHEGFQYAAFYDSTAHVVLAKRKLDTRNWEIRRTRFTGNVNDAHNIISIMVDGQGYLHMAWDHHNTTLKYSVATSPGSMKMEEPQDMIGTNENVVSYPEFYRLDNGNLLFAYRDGGSGNGNLVLNRYDTKTKKWSRLHDNLIDGEGKRNAYWQICTEDDNVYLSWVWRETPDVATNHDMCFARSKDGGLTWEKSTGEPYALPIRMETAEIADHIPQNSNLMNQTSMTVQQGIPYIATYFKGANDLCTQFYVIYQKNGSWKRSKVSDRALDFDLGGVGTRSIPISRPQIVCRKTFLKKPQLFVIYRDEAFGNAVLITKGKMNRQNIRWEQTQLTDYSVDRWEPSYDIELWQHKKELHLFVQRVGQAQGEKAVAVPAQMVRVLEVRLSKKE